MAVGAWQDAEVHVVVMTIYQRTSLSLSLGLRLDIVSLISILF
jgi:hypothetical protein